MCLKIGTSDGLWDHGVMKGAESFEEMSDYQFLKRELCPWS